MTKKIGKEKKETIKQGGWENGENQPQNINSLIHTTI